MRILTPESAALLADKVYDVQTELLLQLFLRSPEFSSSDR